MSRKKAVITINYDWCKRCGICSAFCPKNVFETDNSGKPSIKDIDACVLCRMCEKRCPDLAINVEEVKE
jgi:2-oxoglutarate ferredoxin oxidoreductase subunit delta